MLTPRERILINISVFYTVQHRANVRREILRARRRRVPRRCLEELFVHFSLILGFPSMLDGLERLQECWPAEPASPRTKPSARRGMVVLKRIYGNQTEKLLSNLERLHPETVGWIVRDVYGKVFSRPGLSLRERELVTVTVLSLQGLERQLYSHIRGALRLGFQTDSLHAAFNLIERASGRRQPRTRSILGQVVSQKKMS